MKDVVCKSCGSHELYKENGYLVCKYCGTRYFITAEDTPEKEANISLNDDVERLLQRCKEDPSRARKCAERILEIDPTNAEARKILNGTESGSSGGCYIATCVYGSYNCPEVWTLRRFRDYTLASTWFGKLFIKCYYAISPTLVKWFGETKWFHSVWKAKLDKLVFRLNSKGIENTVYTDRD